MDAVGDSALRVEGYRLISRCFAYPDERLLADLASGEFASGVRGLCEDGPIVAAYRGRPVEEFATPLRSAYTKLFIGTPHPLCAPYESSQRSSLRGRPADLFVNPCARGVLDAYRSCGVVLAEDNVEPPDHISAEAEFAALLVHAESEGNSLPVRYNDFYASHVGLWFYLLAASLRKHAREPLYVWAADLLDAVAPRSRAADVAEELARLEGQALRDHEENDVLLRERLNADIATSGVHGPGMPSGR